jgi:hypothetical protein
MASDSLVPLTHEDLLLGLDGSFPTSLYDMLESIPSWRRSDYSHDENMHWTEYKTTLGNLSFTYCINLANSEQRGLPSSHQLRLRVPDRTTSGEYEYEFWGEVRARVSGTKLFKGYRVPDFGHPHPFELKSHEKGWGWNSFYCDRVNDSDKRTHLLDKDTTGEIWRALMLLTISHRESRVVDNPDLVIVQSRSAASMRLADMVLPVNTFWGD